MIWAKGKERISGLLSSGELEQVSGDAANGEFLLDEARVRLRSAQLLQQSDLVSSFEIAYEGVRHAATALLTQQGLRPTTRGGHVAICSAVTAQFGDHFNFFDRMRQQRNALEYPRGPEALQLQAEVVDRVHVYLQETIEKAEQLMPSLSLWQ